MSGLVVGDHVLAEPHRLRVEVRGHSYRISAGAFWQVHRGAPELLSGVVLEMLAPRRGDRVLDLFAGVGLFSSLLGEAVGPRGSVLGIERDTRACADARHNNSGQSQVQIRQELITPALLAGLPAYDLAVLDPPREGAGRAVMAALLGHGRAARRIAYVSCDPATFARDLKVVLDEGWKMSSLRAFDLFPMTEHVEVVALFEPPDNPDQQEQ